MYQIPLELIQKIDNYMDLITPGVYEGFRVVQRERGEKVGDNIQTAYGACSAFALVVFSSLIEEFSRILNHQNTAENHLLGRTLLLRLICASTNSRELDLNWHDVSVVSVFLATPFRKKLAELHVIYDGSYAQISLDNEKLWERSEIYPNFDDMVKTVISGQDHRLPSFRRFHGYRKLKY